MAQAYLGNTELNQLWLNNTQINEIENLKQPISASGGQEITIGNYKYHIFTGSFDTLSNENFVIHTNSASTPITVLSVARGGNGGSTSIINNGAGGGGGVEISSVNAPAGNYIMATSVTGTFGSGNSIAFSGSAYQVIAQRGGNGATNTVTASNGGGGDETNVSGSINVYGYSGSNYGEGAGNDFGAGAGVGGNGVVRGGDSSVGGIGIYIADFIDLNGQFTSGSDAIYYGGYPDGYYGGGGGGRTVSQLGEGTQGGGGRNSFPNAYGVGTPLNSNGVDFVGGGGMGGNPDPLGGSGRGGRGAIYIRYPITV